MAGVCLISKMEEKPSDNRINGGVVSEHEL